jgi:hypothetical protein
MRLFHKVGDICQTRYGQLVLIVQRYDNGTSDFYKVRFIGNESGDNANFRTADLIRLVDVEDTCQP